METTKYGRFFFVDPCAKVISTFEYITKRFGGIFEGASEGKFNPLTGSFPSLIQRQLDQRIIGFVNLAKRSGLNLREVKRLPLYEYYILMENFNTKTV